MKYSQRAKKLVPVYRIVWGYEALEAMRDGIGIVILESERLGVCYRVK